MVCTLTAPCLLHVIRSTESHGVLSLPPEKCSIVSSHNLPAYKHAVDAAASGLKTKWGLKPVSTVVAKVWCYSVFPIYRRQHQQGITKNTSLEHKNLFWLSHYCWKSTFKYCQRGLNLASSNQDTRASRFYTWNKKRELSMSGEMSSVL